MKAKLFLFVSAIGLFVFNLSFENGIGKEKTVTLQNVKIMQANAAETTCEATEDSSCTMTIYTSGGGAVIGTSKSPMVYTKN